jgi:hypothetical protein
VPCASASGLGAVLATTVSASQILLLVVPHNPSIFGASAPRTFDHVEPRLIPCVVVLVLAISRREAVSLAEVDSAGEWPWHCSDRSTNKPVGQQKSACWLTNQPIGYWANPLLSIRNITLFGQRPSPLDNGLFGQATGRPVGERSGPKDVPCALGWQPALGCQGLPGCPCGCSSWAKSLSTHQPRG